jgi:hypothetical protein
MKTIALLVPIVMVACVAPAPAPAPTAFPHGEIVDLSHTYDSTTIYWPTAEGFQLRTDAEGVTPAGYYYAANSLFTSNTAARTPTRRSTLLEAARRSIRFLSIG